MTFLVIIAILAVSALLCLTMSVYWAARAIAEARNNNDRQKLPTTRANVSMPAVMPPDNRQKAKENNG